VPEEEQQKREILAMILEANRRALAADREANGPPPQAPDGGAGEEVIGPGRYTHPADDRLGGRI
jgi:hypothetical protein